MKIQEFYVSAGFRRMAIGAAIMCVSFVTVRDLSKGTMLYKTSKKTFNTELKYAFFITGPDAFDGKKMIKRLIFSSKDISDKIKSCPVMNCVDGHIDGLQVDLGAAPRLLYWLSLDNQMTQYSGTAQLTALTLTTDTKDQMSGTLRIDDSEAGGPKIQVVFDATLKKAFTKHR